MRGQGYGWVGVEEYEDEGLGPLDEDSDDHREWNRTSKRKREEQKRQAQALIRKDGDVHVAEAEDERASMIVYAKIIVSHFQIL